MLLFLLQVVGALAEAKVSRSVDVDALVRVASLMHQRFPEFSKALQKALVKIFEKQKKSKGEGASAAVSGVTLDSSTDSQNQPTESESQKQMKQYASPVSVLPVRCRWPSARSCLSSFVSFVTRGKVRRAL